MNVLVFGLGAAYAGGLWSIALRVADRRALNLGGPPYALLLFCGIVAVAVHTFVAPGIAVLAGSSLIGAIVCALVDARTGLIFDALSQTMVVVAAAVSLYEGRFVDGVIAAAVVGGALTAVYLLSRGRGIGLGDVKLGCAIALGYGVGAAVITIGCAFILGAAYALVMIGLGRAKRSDAVRFGPFIAGGAALGLSAGVVSWPW